MTGFVPLTRDELELARAFLKTYFPNKGDDRHVFNRICDMAQSALTDRAQRTEERETAFLAWMRKEAPITFAAFRDQFDRECKRSQPQSHQEEKP